MSKENEIGSGLNERQKQFCKNYVFDWNGTRAYLNAYQDIEESTARVNASKLLTNTNIKEYIQYLKDNVEESVGISKTMVLTELKKMAFTSISDIYENWFTRNEFENLPADVKSAIQKIDTKVKVEYEYNQETEKKEPINVEYVRIEMFDKNRSIEIINKMLGYDAVKKIDLSNSDGTLSNLSTLSTEELILRAEALKVIESKEK